MIEASIEDVRDNPQAWLERAAAGEEIVVVSGGQEVARIAPPRTPAVPLSAELNAENVVPLEADTNGVGASADPADVAEIDAVVRRRIESGVFPTVQEIHRLVEIHGESAWTDLGSMRGKDGGFPDLSQFRKSIRMKGESMSDTVIRMRREARY